MRAEERPVHAPGDRLDGRRNGLIIATAVGSPSQRDVEAAAVAEGRASADMDSGRRGVQKVALRIVAVILIDLRRNPSLTEIGREREWDSCREVAVCASQVAVPDAGMPPEGVRSPATKSRSAPLAAEPPSMWTRYQPHSPIDT